MIHPFSEAELRALRSLRYQSCHGDRKPWSSLRQLFALHEGRLSDGWTAIFDRPPVPVSGTPITIISERSS
jgi:hypothetical protein